MLTTHKCIRIASALVVIGLLTSCSDSSDATVQSGEPDATAQPAPGNGGITPPTVQRGPLEGALPADVDLCVKAGTPEVVVFGTPKNLVDVQRALPAEAREWERAAGEARRVEGDPPPAEDGRWATYDPKAELVFCTYDGEYTIPTETPENAGTSPESATRAIVIIPPGGKPESYAVGPARLLPITEIKAGASR